MWEELPIDDFEWVEGTSQFKKDFIEINNEDSIIGYFTEADAQNLKKLHKTHSDFSIFPETIKTEKKYGINFSQFAW